QDAPHAEDKLVRVMRGRMFDVAVDLRPASPTYRRWEGFELSAENLEALFIPQGFAHGFLTLEPDTDILYQMGQRHVPGQARGIRYDDPAIGVAWPAAPAVIGPADLAWPGL
ncbi:MAG: dTDP-4-dehydrorhamnose 3,5-epimerase, partial [Caulobacteraceae bacterium]|nr:dTDP-4-dehydrorhamnose 3,5-epimerase [Caulobacteraceae bacterium]